MQQATDRRRPTAPLSDADRLVAYVRKQLVEFPQHVVDAALAAAKQHYADGARAMQGALNVAHSVARGAA